jgi:hypothetical protein
MQQQKVIYNNTQQLSVKDILELYEGVILDD